MKAVLFDGAIPRYLATKAATAVAKGAFSGAGRCTRLQDVAPPELPGDRWVRIRTILGGVCGSDLNLVSLNVSPSTSPFSSFPFVIGHENVGIITETGNAVRTVKPGSRVVVNPLLACAVRGVEPPCAHCAAGYPSRCEHFTDGVLAPGMLLGTTRGLGGSWGEEYVAHESQLLPVPGTLSDRAAVLTEPLACVVSPLLQHAPASGSRALVIGAGSMGLLATAALTALCDCDVTVLARHSFQAEHALRQGAARTVPSCGKDRLSELSRIAGGRLLQPVLGPPIHVGGFDTTVLCVGSNVAMQDALRFTRAGGTILLLANVASLKGVDWTPVWLKEISIRGSLCYNAPAHAGASGDAFATALSLLAGSRSAQIESLVTHTVPLVRFKHAIDLMRERSSNGAVKVVLSPQ